MKIIADCFLRRMVLQCLLLFSPFLSHAQSLLLNGSFEEENICFEYHVNCAPEAWFTNDDVFNNYFKDANRAYHGDHCMSIEAGHALKPFKRTFIRSQLLCGLRRENRYRIRFFIKSPHRILDSIGVYFSATDPLFDRRPLESLTPQVYLRDINQSIRKDSTWQAMDFNYTATGDEAFICIGNFSRRDITGPTGLVMENHFFCFVDSVSMVPLDPHEQFCDAYAANMVQLYDQDERHDILRRKIRAGQSRNPMPVVTPTMTVQHVDTLILQEVLFQSGSAALQPDAYRLLDSFSRVATHYRVDSVIVEGHTDDRGSAEMNNRLSAARVQTVLNYFASRSFVRPNRVFARAWGETRPVADNSTAAGRQRNRRVVAFLYTRE